MSERAEKWIKDTCAALSVRDAELVARAVHILENNVFRGQKFPWDPYLGISPGLPGFKGIWNWDTAFIAEGVSYFDTELAESSINAFFVFQDSRGMLPDVVFPDGRKVDQFTKPPVFAKAVETVYRRGKNREFLETIYPKLVKNEVFWTHYRMHDGLLHYDSFDKDSEDYLLHVRYESGWDNAVRWDKPICDFWAIDLNCFMVEFYRSMQYLASELGKTDDISVWKQKEKSLSELICERMWNEELNAYVDVNRFTGEKSDVLSPASFMPLYIGIAPKEYAERMDKTAHEKFLPGMPTVSYDNPAHGTDYWRGPTWLNVAYFAAKGLKNYGFDNTANTIKETLLGWCEKNPDGLYENYDSVTGKGLCFSQFSWSSAFVIEFILGF